jgi:hypothetical protein
VETFSFLKKFVAFVISFSFFYSAHSEYRVFLLEIRNPENKITRQIQSTMDPVQYSSVYPLAPQEVIMYQDTWMCPGHTGNYQQHCPRPTKD